MSSRGNYSFNESKDAPARIIGANGSNDDQKPTMDHVGHTLLTYDPDETNRSDRELWYLDTYQKIDKVKNKTQFFVELRQYMRVNKELYPTHLGIMWYVNEFIWILDHYNVNIQTLQAFRSFKNREITAQHVVDGLHIFHAPLNVNSELKVPFPWMNGHYCHLPDYEFNAILDQREALQNTIGRMYSFAVQETDEFNGVWDCYVKRVFVPNYKCPPMGLNRDAEGFEDVSSSIESSRSSSSNESSRSSLSSISNSPPVPLNLSTVDPRDFVRNATSTTTTKATATTPVSNASSLGRIREQYNSQTGIKRAISNVMGRVVGEEGPPAKQPVVPRVVPVTQHVTYNDNFGFKMANSTNTRGTQTR